MITQTIMKKIASHIVAGERLLGTIEQSSVIQDASQAFTLGSQAEAYQPPSSKNTIRGLMNHTAFSAGEMMGHASQLFKEVSTAPQTEALIKTLKQVPNTQVKASILQSISVGSNSLSTLSTKIKKSPILTEASNAYEEGYLGNTPIGLEQLHQKVAFHSGAKCREMKKAIQKERTKGQPLKPH